MRITNYLSLQPEGGLRDALRDSFVPERVSVRQFHATDVLAMAASGKWIDGIGPETRVEEAARRGLEARLRLVTYWLPLAAHLAEHDIEHVHRLRVATRRAVAAVKLYRDLLPWKSARWIKKRLRKVRQAAGDARDLDVLGARLKQEFGERVASVIALIAEKRSTVQPAIVHVAERCREDDRFVRKTSTLLSGIRSPETNGHAVEQPVLYRDWAATEFAKVARPFLDAMPDESADVVALHQFRIRAKALRYAIELVAPGFGPELREELYPIVEDLQERLGRIQDHVTAQSRLKDWGAKEDHEPRKTLLLQLADSEGLALNEKVCEFHAWWTPGRVDDVRRALPGSVSTFSAIPAPQAVFQS
jgi:CHAD domain-containing protein